MAESGDVVFTTVVEGSDGKTGIVVPPEVVEQLGAGQRPPVHVDLDGYAYRSTVAVLGGRHLISVSAAVRAAKTAETRQRRVDKALALFREGRKR